MTNSITLKAYAKINPYLKIKGVKENMHLIDTIIVPLEILFDEVKVTVRGDDLITVSMEPSFDIPQEKNIAYKTARAISKHFLTAGVDISIKKNIPIGAGFGGSSADGAAVAKAMARLFNLEIRPAMLIKMGSDIPAMYYGEAVRVGGIGEKLMHVTVNLPKFMVAIVHYEQINSKEAYDMYDTAGGADVPNLRLNENNEFPFIEKYCKNDLSVAAEIILPDLMFAQELLEEAGADFTFLTGSGSALIGVFSKDKIDESLKVIEEGEKIVGESKFYSLKLF